MDYKALFEAIRKELVVNRKYQLKQISRLIGDISESTASNWLTDQDQKPYRRPEQFIKLVKYSMVNLDDFADLNSLGGRVELLRWKNELSVSALAEKIGRSSGSVLRIERSSKHKGKPSMPTIIKLAKVLNTTPDYILNGDIKKPIKNGLRDLPKETAPKVEFTIDVNATNSFKNLLGNLELHRITKEFAKHLVVNFQKRDFVQFGIQESNKELLTIRDIEELQCAIRGYRNNQGIKIEVITIPDIASTKSTAIEDIEDEVDEPNFTIPPENEIVINPKVMLSTEIAVLTGKLHKNVMRDIAEIDQKLTSSNLSWLIKPEEYKAGNGQMQPCYELDYQATMIVLTGYDVVARAKVIKRWQELEEMAKLIKTPQIEQPTPQLFVPSSDGNLSDEVCKEFKKALSTASRCGLRESRAEQYANTKVKNIHHVDVLKTLVGM